MTWIVNFTASVQGLCFLFLFWKTQPIISFRSARVKEREQILTIENCHLKVVLSQALFQFFCTFLSCFLVCRAFWGCALLIWCSGTSANYYYINFFIICDSHNILQRVITFPTVKRWWAEWRDLTIANGWTGTQKAIELVLFISLSEQMQSWKWMEPGNPEFQSLF